MWPARWNANVGPQKSVGWARHERTRRAQFHGSRPSASIFCLFVSHSFLSFLSFLSARERRKGSRTNPSRETSILAASIQLWRTQQSPTNPTFYPIFLFFIFSPRSAVGVGGKPKWFQVSKINKTCGRKRKWTWREAIKVTGNDITHTHTNNVGFFFF